MTFFSNFNNKDLPVFKELIDLGIVKIVNEAYDLKGNLLENSFALYCEQNHRLLVYNVFASRTK